jgi:DNA replication initiation complex subunit (GINS family)
MNFALMQYHKYSLTEIENLIPFEKDIYVAMLVNYLEEEKQRIQSKQHG